MEHYVPPVTPSLHDKSNSIKLLDFARNFSCMHNIMIFTNFTEVLTWTFQNKLVCLFKVYFKVNSKSWRSNKQYIIRFYNILYKVKDDLNNLLQTFHSLNDSKSFWYYASASGQKIFLVQDKRLITAVCWI